MREALRHLVDDVPACGPDGYDARWAKQAAEALAEAESYAADLAAWSPWDEDGESCGYRDVIADHKTLRGLYHRAGIYAARAAGDPAAWGCCGPDCPGCRFADQTRDEFAESLD